MDRRALQLQRTSVEYLFLKVTVFLLQEWHHEALNHYKGNVFIKDQLIVSFDFVYFQLFYEKMLPGIFKFRLGFENCVVILNGKYAQSSLKILF